MSQRFTPVDYEAVLNQTIRVQEVLLRQHLAHFIVSAIAQLDLKAFYARYAERGGAAIAPEVLLGILLYGYASGVFSSRKLERATYESIPFRYVAGGLHPDHDTIAHFRKVFLTEIKALFVQVLLLAQTYGALTLGNISLDGTKIHADAAKSKAVVRHDVVSIAVAHPQGSDATRCTAIGILIAQALLATVGSEAAMTT